MTALRVHIDRHAFASNASSFDTAWRTFGWTPGIEGERAGRLEESVPWAKVTSRAERPAWLRGVVTEVLGAANFDRLQFAFLPQDGRLGFSVWGAIGDDRAAGGWRVLTHTLLFDTPTFHALAGYPFGLLIGALGGGWFREMVENLAFERPAPLTPVVVPFSASARARFERARLQEVKRLRDRLIKCGPHSISELEQRLAALYEGIALAMRGGAFRRVALRAGGEDPESSLLVRLAWLTLPPRDRANTFFNTEQHRTESPAATLIVLPESEWGPFAPEATRLLGVDPAGEESEASSGRRLWARVALEDSRHHGELCARVGARGWALVLRDDVTRIEALEQWRRVSRRLSLAKVRELIDIECAVAGKEGPVRWRAIGHLIGRALNAAGRGAGTAPGEAVELLRKAPASRAGSVLRAALRNLSARKIEDLAREADGRWLWQDEVVTRFESALFARSSLPNEPSYVARAAGTIVDKLLATVNSTPLDIGRQELVLRLSWLEWRYGAGVTAVERYGADQPHAAVPVLLQLLVSSPPLPLFLRVRRVLLHANASHYAGRPEVERWRTRVEECCPVLMQRFPRERREPILETPLVLMSR